MGKKHLSEVLTVAELLDIPNNRVCVLAGVGAGKNYFVKNCLKGHGNIFFISSRRATVNEMLLDEICKEAVDWNRFSDEIFTTTNYGVELLVKNKRFSTTGVKNIIEHFDIIVIDEFHSLKADATFADSAFHLYTFLNLISEKYPSTKIIVMTGTAEPVKDILVRDNYAIFDKRSECINVLPQNIEVITYDEAVEIIQTLPTSQKTIYYTNSTEKSIWGKSSLFRKLIKGNYYTEKEISIAIAKDKAQEIMDKRDCPICNLVDVSEKTKEYIVTNHSLPAETRVLITTSTLKEGINITAKDIKLAFCESHILSDIQQFAGRVRNGLDTLYIINDGYQFDISFDQQRKNFLEALFNVKILDKINEFFQNQIKNDASCIYHKEFGKYNPEEAKLYNLFLSDDWSIYGVSEPAKAFIDLVEKKHAYIRFNHLTSKFQIFATAYREQTRIHEYFAAGWEKAVRMFCKENGIGYVNNTDSKEIDISTIKKGLESFVGIKLFNKERDRFLLFVSNSLRLFQSLCKLKNTNVR